jgi:uncharacterized caspase-like protein
LLLGVGSAGAQPAEQRVALVVGNSNYLTVNSLRNPTHDAKAMADALRRVGFDVIEKENVTRHELVQSARSFSEKLAPGGVGFFYYAGHGVQTQGINYLIPIDASVSVEEDLKYEAFDVQDILDRLTEARVRLSVVILDACRDNPFAKSFRSVSRGLARIDPARGTILAYATAPGQVADDGDGDNGIYTGELLKAMSEPGKKLQDIFYEVTDAVERRTGNRQTPWINSSFRGDFFFVRPLTPPTDPPALMSVSAEIVFWQSIASSTNPLDYEAYLKTYPHGSFATLAQLRRDLLTKLPTPSDFSPSASVQTVLSSPMSPEKTSNLTHSDQAGEITPAANAMVHTVRPAAPLKADAVQPLQPSAAGGTAVPDAVSAYHYTDPGFQSTDSSFQPAASDLQSAPPPP